MSCWIISYVAKGDGVRLTIPFHPAAGFAGAGEVVEAIARNERPEAEFSFGRNDTLTVRQVMKAYQIEDSIRHRPDFSVEDAKLSTDEASCKAWRPLSVRYGNRRKRHDAGDDC